MSTAKRLIDKARLLGHSDPKLHKMLGLSGRSYIGDVYNGKKQLSPEVAALLADLVGENPQEAAARQLVENAQEPRKSLLERALFTLGALGVAFAGLGTPTTTDAKATAANPITDVSTLERLYIVGPLLWWLRRAFRAADAPACGCRGSYLASAARLNTRCV